MISGKSILLPMFGYPTEPFKAPYIYNPWFESKDIDAVVVPMGVKPENYAEDAQGGLPHVQCSRRAGDDAAQGDDR